MAGNDDCPVTTSFARGTLWLIPVMVCRRSVDLIPGSLGWHRVCQVGQRDLSGPFGVVKKAGGEWRATRLEQCHCDPVSRCAVWRFDGLQCIGISAPAERSVDHDR